MDPDKALRNARAAAYEIMRDSLPAPTQEAADLCEAFEALDGWLRAGGFLPAAWADARRRLTDAQALDAIVRLIESNPDGLVHPLETILRNTGREVEPF